MGPHMKMTTLRDLKPGDQEKSRPSGAAARKGGEKYTTTDCTRGPATKSSAQNLPQKQYHFTNVPLTRSPDSGDSLQSWKSDVIALYRKAGDDYKC